MANTIRISTQTQQILKELAAHSGSSMQKVLEQAVEAYRRQQFFADLDTAYAALWDNPEAAQTEQEEQHLWDAILMDGLNPTEM